MIFDPPLVWLNSVSSKLGEGRNSWNFTRLGRINNVTTEELREILGDGNVTITLFLPQE
jgi:hypothetical protein